MNLFMPLFLVILGYSTILPYMEAGIKSAAFLSPIYGTKMYFIYGSILFFVFSYIESHYAFIFMNLTGGLLILINLFGILKLRRKLDYNL
jgi:AGCS family alanine or glycine:cation symporter